MDFLKSQVVNRLQAFGVIIDGIRNKDFKQIANGLLQFETGIENVVDKGSALVSLAVDAGVAAGELEAAQQKLAKQRKELAVDEVLEKGRVEELIRLSKDRTKSASDRLGQLREAGKLENELSAKSLKLTGDELALLKQRNAARKLNVSADELQEVRDKQQEYNQVLVDRNNLLATIKARQSRFIVEEAAELKAAADRQMKARRDELELENKLLDQQLLKVQAGSDEELSILQEKLHNSYLAELEQKGLTLKQLLLLDTKYEADGLALVQDFTKKRGVAMFDAAVAANSAELLAVKQGTDAETDLRREAIQTQLERELFALDKRKDNAAQEALLRATAAKQLNDVNYNAALAKLNTFLSDQRAAIDDAQAQGKLSKAAYDKAVLVSDQVAAGSRLQLAREYGQQTTQLEKANADAQRAAIRSVTEAEQAEQAKRVALAEQLASGLSSLFAETVADTGATLDSFARSAFYLIINTMEQAVLAAQVKTVAEAFATPESLATFGAAGFAKALIIIAASTALAETFKSQLKPPTKQFAQGGIAVGPSHAQGGISLYHQGRPAGIEIGGGEAVLTRKVSQNPLLLSLASTVNQLAGGRALTASLPSYNFAALGAITRPAAQQWLRQQGGSPADAAAIGAAVADALRRNPARNVWSDFKAAEARNRFTDNMSNS